MLYESEMFFGILKRINAGVLPSCKYGIPDNLLKAAESKLKQPLNDVSRRFLLECSPSITLESYLYWLGWNDIWEYNFDSDLYSLCLKQGFFLFAQDNGSPFALNTCTNQVHLLEMGYIGDLEFESPGLGYDMNFLSNAESWYIDTIWPSTKNFMDWLNDKGMRLTNR